jgi:hypothetical protein
LSDTIDTSGAEAWMSGNMQEAQALNQPIPDDAPAGDNTADEVPSWLPVQNNRPGAETEQATTETATISRAATKLTELGAEGRALVAEWGGHTSPDFKENLAYAKSAFADNRKEQAGPDCEGGCKRPR